MATNIDKALYQQPAGLEALAQEEEPIEIEIVDPEAVKIGVGDLEISLEMGENEEDFGANLAEEMDEGAMASMASTLVDEIEQDKNSRKDWEKAYTEGLKLLGLNMEERTEPWNGASGVFHPMITEAVVRFQAETITETFPAQGPVRTKIIGKETPEKKEAAMRVEQDMNYQLTEKMVEFRPEHERMLWSLPATGSAFKKVYYDPGLGRQVSIFIPAEDMLLPYGTSDIQTCYRVTHIMRKTKNEITKLQSAGFYRDVELGEPDKAQSDIQKAKDKETGFSDLNDERFTLLECNVDLDLKGYEDEDDEGDTGIALPYVVTLIKGTNTVLAIRRNWEEDDPLKLKRQHFVHYQYIPGFGAYGFGLFHLIGGFAKSATSLMRQLIDAGTLANLPGGLKSRGLRIKGDDTPIAPGEFRDVDVGSGTIRDSILPLPYKEPSQTLYTLLQNVVDEGRRFAATADMKISDMSGQAPVGTTLALLERQLKVMTAVQARVHFALKQELKLLAVIIRDFSDDDYGYEPEGNQGPRAKSSDYKHVDIIPVSDPNAATMSQRVVQYQAVIQMAQMAPDIYDLPQLHRRMLEVLGIKNPDKLIPLEEDMKPVDPVTENQSILKGKPVKAFLHQDHKSHIAVHNSMPQDPSIAALIGQNPQAPKIAAALQAHIAEHVGYMMRQQIEAQLGMPLPPEDEKLPPEIEIALSAMMAQAAQQVVQQNQAQAAQQQAQQQQQDPVVQMQQAELQIKQQEVQIKQQEAQMRMQLEQAKMQMEQAKMQMAQQTAQQDLQIRQQQMELTATSAADKQKLEEQKVTGQLQLDGMRIGAQIEESQAKQQFDQAHMGARLDLDVADTKTKNAMQAAQIMETARNLQKGNTPK
jgi:hypothetical protein